MRFDEIFPSRHAPRLFSLRSSGVGGFFGYGRKFLLGRVYPHQPARNTVYQPVVTRPSDDSPGR